MIQARWSPTPSCTATGSSRRANEFVELYTDRIEIVSPGGLPKGMTDADLGRKSVRRNALIADLLHRIGFIEKAGTGIKRIRTTLPAMVNGLPADDLDNPSFGSEPQLSLRLPDPMGNG